MKVQRSGMAVPTGPTGVLSSSRGGVRPGGTATRRRGKSALKGTQMKRVTGKR